MQTPVASRRPIPSPCSGVCQLDALGLCLGCRRSGTEIALWRQMDDAERLHLMREVLPARGWEPVHPVQE